ncbi:ComEA family DNA-binding protein [Aeromicrobium phragmitis]|uniref:ComEA family DNA-binding protein n=1 Tax=Aeromicrobium phragmitis TaxID=2478914 RepID=A0A3L8PMM5_9ACTN|nr:ComEA family DNA-binding protein [Aeromicrobium phragmitis]RLV56605.1 ComEA family DNA-binding protein [Aeromicrobium phragmitis]
MIRGPAPEETRAEVARRRLAELAAAFDAQWQPEDDPAEGEPPGPRHARLRDRHLALLGIAGVAVLVLVGWWVLAGRPETIDEPVAIEPSAEPSSAPAKELVIDVVGAVARPGIVTVPPGSRVHEAIEAAGGLVGQPDTTSLNMARELTDGEQLLVGITPPPVAGGTGGAEGRALDLNRADQPALEELPGIGPVTASAILDWRSENGPFRSVDDLLDVKGIGEATLAELRDHVVVQ